MCGKIKELTRNLSEIQGKQIFTELISVLTVPVYFEKFRCIEDDTYFILTDDLEEWIYEIEKASIIDIVFDEDFIVLELADSLNRCDFKIWIDC